MVTLVSSCEPPNYEVPLQICIYLGLLNTVSKVTLSRASTSTASLCRKKYKKLPLYKCINCECIRPRRVDSRLCLNCRRLLHPEISSTAAYKVGIPLLALHATLPKRRPGFVKAFAVADLQAFCRIHYSLCMEEVMRRKAYRKHLGVTILSVFAAEEFLARRALRHVCL